MDAVQLLLDDHETVRELYRQYQSASDQQKASLAQQILHELEAHSKIEEEIFYPAFRTRAGADGKEVIAEAYEEHADVDQLVAQLSAMQPSDASFRDLFSTMMQNVEHHIQEEETEILPVAKQTMAQQLDLLGEQMAQRKAQLKQELQAKMSR